MIYLLDTNVCISLMSEVDDLVRQAYQEAVLEGATLAVSSVVLFELNYGVEKSIHSAASQHRLNDFLRGPIDVLAFAAPDAVVAGRIRAQLEKSKTPIGLYDTLIAGQALARGMTLVTANVREFSRVKDLRWVDWAK